MPRPALAFCLTVCVGRRALLLPSFSLLFFIRLHCLALVLVSPVVYRPIASGATLVSLLCLFSLPSLTHARAAVHAPRGIFVSPLLYSFDAPLPSRRVSTHGAVLPVLVGAACPEAAVVCVVASLSSCLCARCHPPPSGSARLLRPLCVVIKAINKKKENALSCTIQRRRS